MQIFQKIKYKLTQIDSTKTLSNATWGLFTATLRNDIIASDCIHDISEKTSCNWVYETMDCAVRLITYLEMTNLEERTGKESHPRDQFQKPLCTQEL